MRRPLLVATCGTLLVILVTAFWGLLADAERRAAAQFECSSRGMEAYVAGRDEAALHWLGEANRAALTGRCEG